MTMSQNSLSARNGHCLDTHDLDQKLTSQRLILGERSAASACPYQPVFLDINSKRVVRDAGCRELHVRTVNNDTEIAERVRKSLFQSERSETRRTLICAQVSPNQPRPQPAALFRPAAVLALEFRVASSNLAMRQLHDSANSQDLHLKASATSTPWASRSPRHHFISSAR